jgi:hypothetical protein
VNEVIRAAVERTFGAGTARVVTAHGASPVPDEGEWRGEGVTDFAARLSLVNESVMPGVPAVPELYDGRRVLVGDGSRWGVFADDLPDREGPRHPGDPVWPLEALLGATRADGPDGSGEYAVTIDFEVADAALPAGIHVPAAAWRMLRAMPAVARLDADGRVIRAAVAQGTGLQDREVLWVVTDFSDFGAPVDIDVPADGDVMPAAELDWGD